MKDSLAVLNKTANVLDQLNNGAFSNSSCSDSIVELSGEHSVLSGSGIGKQKPVPLLLRIIRNQLDVQNLDERLRVHVAGDYRRDRVRREIHRHTPIPDHWNKNPMCLRG